MRIFDTDVQKLKYMVLREVARRAFEGRMKDSYLEIPKLIAPGPSATMRCCIYKERAIVQERIRIALGGDRESENIVEVIDIACDGCPISTYTVGAACRGCIAHRCVAACPRGAITFDAHQKAMIDPETCVECGRCADVCPYHAIAKHKRPCESACRTNAISRGANDVAEIDASKCTNCGACVYQCPFGAMSDRSFILDAIDMIKRSDENRAYRVYAIVAPSISSQFRYAKLGQVVTALKRLGFYSVVEVALGADMVAWHEAGELAEKGFLTSSCCPAFVEYIEEQFPNMRKHVSTSPSPMAALAQYIKKGDPEAKVVFIGPCTAKKVEARRAGVREYVDCVLTFEELQALIDSRDFDISHLPEDVLDNASYYGRIFARVGGLTDAVAQALKEREIDFKLKPVVCDGIEACRAALLKASRGMLDGNFIEGMACVGGCIGGAGCLTHGRRDAGEVDKYGREALEKRISDALKMV
ncbi:MAG: 4Fe-4S dicluster domain-containing protein [Christensenellales bacterium]|jgi:[FeFe] hydrogenase (group B1/B3)